MTLTIEACGVDGFEEHIQQELQIGHLLVVLDANGFGEACRIGIYLFIRRVFSVAVGESHLRLYDSLDLFEEVLGAPEAAAGKVNLFQHFILI